MKIKDLSELTRVQERAIIINVNTKLVTTLALLSTIRHAKMPTLLIDCQSTDGSYQHFLGLMKKYEFDMITAPLRNHGVTLDWVFSHAKSEKILLVDSDLEIKSPEIIGFCKEHIDDFNVFGCGFTNGPAWLTGQEFTNTNLYGALYIERMWIPLTLLRVDPIQVAINEGKSFTNFDFDNEYSLVPTFAKLRKENACVRKLFKRGPRWLRLTIHGARPSFICYATGAQIFEYLRYERFMSFVGLPESTYQKYVTHFGGVTRNTLDRTDNLGCQSLEMISDEVRKGLSDVYEEFV